MSARRAIANTFFSIVNSALLAFVSSRSLSALWLVALAGFALSATWGVLLESYQDLNAAKVEIITGIESCLSPTFPYVCSFHPEAYAVVRPL